MIVSLLITTLVAGSAVGETGPRDGELKLVQQRIVADLTGHETPEGGSRSTAAERSRAAAYLEKAIAGLGLTPQRHEYRLPNVNGLVDLLLSPYRGTNVYTVLESTTGSEQYVVVGAHYDTVPDSPGAVDNASGVALVFALALELSRIDERRLGFIFVFFDQEEDDEVGSRAFVRYIESKSIDVHSAHISDLVGWDEDGDRAVEVQSPGPLLEQQYRAAASRLGLRLHVTEGASSDNKSFLEAGYRTAGVWEEWDHDDSTPHLHRSSDAYETVNFDFLESTTKLVLDVLRNLEVADGE